MEQGKTDDAVRILEGALNRPHCPRVAGDLLAKLGSSPARPRPRVDAEVATAISDDLETGGAFRIACGSGKPMEVDGVPWNADCCFFGGRPSRIGGARTFPRHEYGGYFVPLPEGPYRVTLWIRERWFRGTGLRVFDVRLEGKRVLEALDPYGENNAGKDAKERWSFPVDVTDGVLEIRLEPSAGDPVLSGIIIEKR
jgi:hypothetical protein